MEKYYIPKSNELHIGFECECFNETNREYLPCIFNQNDLCNFEILAGYCRVKYLDREDIESLGWRFVIDEGHQEYDFDNFTLDVCSVQIQKGLTITISLFNLGASGFSDKTIFRGQIKNKSELRRLMQQLMIAPK